MNRKKINIFVISPSDVEEERRIVKEVCDNLNRATDKTIEISCTIWEDYPLPYAKNPQESIDDLLINADMYIVILWHRLGTSVEGCTGAITGEQNVTGTQYEIEKVLALGKEYVYFYFKLEEPMFTSKELDEALRQKRLLERFVDVMQLKKNRTKHGYQEFHAAKEFKERIATHLQKEVERISGKRVTVKKEKVSSYILIFFVVVLVMGIGYVMMIPSASKHIQKPKVSINSINSQPVRRGFYVSKRDNLTQGTYLLLLQVFKDKKVVKSKNMAAYEVVFSSQSQEKHYIVANTEMVQSLCKMGYSITDLTKHIVADTYQYHTDAIDFDVDRAKERCLEDAYKGVSGKLMKTLKGL